VQNGSPCISAAIAPQKHAPVSILPSIPSLLIVLNSVGRAVRRWRAQWEHQNRQRVPSGGQRAERPQRAGLRRKQRSVKP
ncbi:hypothetical protein, partial [Mesorhizobium sp. M1A.F.Ca.IN.020.03.2.1]|uniref:hypothetical protein n=1 Tax=Mesorhizobium sp. M1A.F.Ca.IN.020.03.2.1 TaxID=2496769 RepID=UPI0019D4745C